MTSTQDSLLDAAEALFVEKGYAATSLRSIAARAKVNLAATHYHFGSKEGLVAALVHRRVTPINQARLKALDTLEQANKLDVVSILEAFLMPITSSEEIEYLPGLIGRIYSEPPSIMQPLIEREFGEVAARFVGALRKVLPELDEEELFWRFHFLVGAMLKTLTLSTPLGLESSKDSYHKKFQRLIQFTNAGFLAPAQSSGEKI